MQQRFSQWEITKEGKPAKVMTTSDMLTHPWILTATDNGSGAGALGNKKKVGHLGSLSVVDPSLAKSGGGSGSQNLKLTLKELLSVSSEWKDVNKKNTGAGGGVLSMDFQSQ